LVTGNYLNNYHLTSYHLPNKKEDKMLGLYILLDGVLIGAIVIGLLALRIDRDKIGSSIKNNLYNKATGYIFCFLSTFTKIICYTYVAQQR
jgi:hypothetical protein